MQATEELARLFNRFLTSRDLFYYPLAIFGDAEISPSGVSFRRMIYPIKHNQLALIFQQGRARLSTLLASGPSASSARRRHENTPPRPVRGLARIRWWRAPCPKPQAVNALSREQFRRRLVVIGCAIRRPENRLKGRIPTKRRAKHDLDNSDTD